MAFLAHEHTSNRHGNATNREYLFFALLLIALLLASGVQIGLSSQTDTGSAAAIDRGSTAPPVP